MPSVLCGLVPLLATLAGEPMAAPSSQVILPQPRSRRMVIPEVTPAPASEARLAPGLVTTFRFEAPLDPTVFSLEGREQYFTLVEVGPHTVTLEPGKALPQTGLPLTVELVEGGFREQATLTLLPASSEVDAQVRVVRAPPSMPVLQARLHTLLTRCDVGTFARLVLSGRIGTKGVTVDILPVQATHSALTALTARVYRAEGLTVVEARLALSGADMKPWLPGEALLMDAEGQVVGRPGVWLDGTRLAPGEKGTVVLEVDPPSHGARRPFLLEIREKDGERAVRVQNLELGGGKP